MAASKHRTGFLDLPPELRNHIYQYLVDDVYPEPVLVLLPTAIKQQPTILHTCRTIRSEARPIYFEKINFIANLDNIELDQVEAFITAFDDSTCASIKSIGFLLKYGSAEDGGSEEGYLGELSENINDIVLRVMYDSTRAKFAATEHTHNLHEVDWATGCLHLGGNRCVSDVSRCAIKLNKYVQKWEGEKFTKQKLLKMLSKVHRWQRYWQDTNNW